MRVLHVIATDQRRGSEVFAADLIQVLAEAGVSQRVATLHGDGRTGLSYAVANSNLPSGGATLPGLRLDVRTVRGLLWARRQWRPDIIQAHGGEALKYVLASSVGRPIPVVYRRIGGSPPWITRGVRRVVYRRLFGATARIVALAEYVRSETLATFDIPPDHVITIPNAVDRERMKTTRDRHDVRRGLEVPDDAPVFLSVCALTWEKDPMVHLEVSSRVLNRVSNAHHLVVGDGPMRRDVEEAAKGLGLNGRIHVLGARSDVADLMATSDALLFASRADGMEGLPTVLIEAGMVGLPAVAYDVAGVGEVVVDHQTGFLVPWGHPEGLAEGVIRLMTEPELRAGMGDEARTHCRERFDIRTVAPRYLRLYEEVLAR
jgi:glycosyltransferase involved in cell wall biosynthesis